MSNSKKLGCIYCDFSDMDIMRKNGYAKEKYVYCELSGAVVEITENCPNCVINHLEQKKQAHMDFLIKQMAEALENKEYSFEDEE